MKPKQVLKLREQWRYRGSSRPAFAIEPQAHEESVWDYPRPPAIVDDGRLVKVYVNDELVAESTHTKRVLETAGAPCFYIPREDVKLEFFSRNSRTTFCEWKGHATYFDALSGDSDVAWSYEEPFDACAEIAGWISFYPSKARCEVDGEQVRSQAGGFYGGWITDEIVGPFKGDPEVIDATKAAKR